MKSATALVVSHRRALVAPQDEIRLEVGEVVLGTVRGIKALRRLHRHGGVSGPAASSLRSATRHIVNTSHTVLNVNDQDEGDESSTRRPTGSGFSLSTKALERNP